VYTINDAIAVAKNETEKNKRNKNSRQYMQKDDQGILRQGVYPAVGYFFFLARTKSNPCV